MIKDSGERTEFQTGAVRDMHEGKGRFDLLPRQFGIYAVLRGRKKNTLNLWIFRRERMITMAEYISREALKQRIRIMPRTANPELVFISTVQTIISTAPTADVVEVVRCKDCKYNEPNWRLTPDGVGCSYWGIYPDPDIGPNCFCSMGAKMDGKGEGE